MERVQKIIARSGYCSRRKADELVAGGKVTINGMVAKTGQKVDLNYDDVIVEGNKINIKNDFKYYVMNKPRQTISAVTDDFDRKTVLDIMGNPPGYFPVGRLDYNTTGVLVITNDGEFANKLINPKSKVPKTYKVKIEGKLQLAQIKKLESGMVIDGYKTKRAKVNRVKYDREKNTSFITLTIYEGKNRQIRKMFEQIGSDVQKLVRVRIGRFEDASLKTGEYRELTFAEKQLLFYK